MQLADWWSAQLAAASARAGVSGSDFHIVTSRQRTTVQYLHWSSSPDRYLTTVPLRLFSTRPRGRAPDRLQQAHISAPATADVTVGQGSQCPSCSGSHHHPDLHVACLPARGYRVRRVVHRTPGSGCSRVKRPFSRGAAAGPDQKAGRMRHRRGGPLPEVTTALRAS